VSISGAEDDVGVQKVAKSFLCTYIASDRADSDIEANLLQMTGHHVHFGFFVVQVCNPGTKHPANVGVGIEEIVIEQDDLGNPYTHQLLCNWRTKTTTTGYSNSDSAQPVMNDTKSISLSIIQGRETCLRSWTEKVQCPTNTHYAINGRELAV
jgi:hypothetical protein